MMSLLDTCVDDGAALLSDLRVQGHKESWRLS